MGISSGEDRSLASRKRKREMKQTLWTDERRKPGGNGNGMKRVKNDEKQAKGEPHGRSRNNIKRDYKEPKGFRNIKIEQAKVRPKDSAVHKTFNASKIR